MSRFDVVGFGALNVDKLFRVSKIAGADEEAFVSSFEEACGGSAANTIVGLARLGCKVSFLGKVAEDREGVMLIDDFRKERVDTTGIIHAKSGRSGVVMGFVDAEGERALYVDSGVNDTLSFSELNSFQARFLHLSSFVGDKSFQAQERLVEALPEKMKISFDPGELYARRGLTFLESIISRTFVLLPSQKELKLLTRTSGHKEGAQVLIKKGVRIVAVKMGSEGCYVTNGDESHLIRAFKVKIVDTTGAGDAFDAGFLYGLLHSKSLQECGTLGNFVASRCITAMGARNNLPQLADLKKSGVA